MMEIFRNSQPPRAGDGAGQIFQNSNTTSREKLGASERPMRVSGVEILDGGASDEIYLDPSLLTEESPLVVTSMEINNLTEGAPGGETSSAQEVEEHTLQGSEGDSLNAIGQLELVVVSTVSISLDVPEKVFAVEGIGTGPVQSGGRSLLFANVREEEYSRHDYDKFEFELALLILSLMMWIYVGEIFMSNTEGGSTGLSYREVNVEYGGESLYLVESNTGASNIYYEYESWKLKWISIIRIWDPGGFSWFCVLDSANAWLFAGLFYKK